MILLFVVYKLVLSSGAQISGAGFRPAMPAFFRGAPSKYAGTMPAWQAGSLLYGGRRA
jgi:hypothetical protein